MLLLRLSLSPDLSSQRRAFLRLLLKLDSVDGKLREGHRNFPEAPRVITLIINYVDRLKFFCVHPRRLSLSFECSSSITCVKINYPNYVIEGSWCFSTPHYIET